MGVFGHGGGNSTFQYPYLVDQSCRFDYNDTANTTRAGSATEEYKSTFSFWFRPGNYAVNSMIYNCSSDVNNDFGLIYLVSNVIQITYTVGGVGKGNYTTSVLKDDGAWYHILVGLNPEAAVAYNRVIVYVNGVRIDGGGTGELYTWQVMPQNTLVRTHYHERGIGERIYDGGYPYDGCLSEFYFIADRTLVAEDFGESINGFWVPKKYTGDYPTESFYLDFSNSSHFGEDQSGLGNDLTDANLAAVDQLEDSPTNTYCRLSPLAAKDTEVTFSNGNTTVDWVGGGPYNLGTLQTTGGKWYFEVTPTLAASTSGFFGVFDLASSTVYAYGADSQYFDGVGWGAYGATYATGDVLGCEFDIDNSTIEFFKNGVSQGQESPSIGVAVPFVYLDSNCTKWVTAFGANGFTHTPTAGFRDISTKWMDPINEGLYMNGDKGQQNVSYTGTGAELAITDLEFQPGLTWLKTRDSISGLVLTDSIRGATKELQSNNTNAEATVAQGLKSFDSSGFTLGTDNKYNKASDEYIAWSWKEDPAYGFDVVTYTGNGANRTIAHSLGATPTMIIIKNLSNVQDWSVYHVSLNTPTTGYLVLNEQDAEANAATMWNSTEPTSSVFSLGTNVLVNTNLDDYVAYLFTDIEGFSATFSYTGTANADGPFLHMGLLPKLVIMKNADDGATSWQMYDRTRSPTGPLAHLLSPNVSDIETSNTRLNLTSHGVKIKTVDAEVNAVGDRIVGIAFAKAPFKYSRGG